MTFGYWFVEISSWIHLLVGIAAGVYGWNKYGDKIKKIWNNITK